MRKPHLTRKQQEAFEKLTRMIASSGASPTLEEFRMELGLKSLNSAKQYIQTFENLGLIRRSPFQKRGIEIIGSLQESGHGIVFLPVISSAGCDAMNIYADQRFDERIGIDAGFIPIGKVIEKLVLFKAIGDSMDAAGISSGDYVLAERTNNIDEGDRVVATVGDMAVIKRFHYGENAILLEPDSHNPKYRKIVLKDISSIFGKVLNIIKTRNDTELTYERTDETEPLPIANH
jgi:SOS regulatory protein LexA